ncbi:MAG: sodium:calcium antiporter [Bacillota bacterium]|nr:sodium:calcium antiporter [Bacillota bacterium]
MFTDILMVGASLALILLSCFIFTNGIEWFGKKLNMGQGVVGSIFAAVGTALPETIIPIIAILYYTDEKANEIGIGAIAGAPFMLGTLAFFVTGLAVITYTMFGKRTLKMTADQKVITRDLSYFLAIYGVAVLTTFIHSAVVFKDIIAVVLLLSYILYLKRSFSDDCAQCEDLDPLYASRIFKVKTSMTWIVVQLLLALAGIIYGAHLFVEYVEDLSTILGVAPLVLSIIITPIATELPEKLNSVIWTGRKKDTLALGNITGAMVFQSCFPVVFGMLFTPWNLKGITLASAILAIASASFNLVWIKVRKTVNPFALLFSGVLYVAFLLYVFL